ncbi:hypothetical protein KIPB_016673, partial [Kipferlia bialata]
FEEVTAIAASPVGGPMEKGFLTTGHHQGVLANWCYMREEDTRGRGFPEDPSLVYPSYACWRLSSVHRFKERISAILPTSVDPRTQVVLSQDAHVF